MLFFVTLIRYSLLVLNTEIIGWSPVTGRRATGRAGIASASFEFGTDTIGERVSGNIPGYGVGSSIFRIYRGGIVVEGSPDVSGRGIGPIGGIILFEGSLDVVD